ncbi:MAG: radical SAM protein [Methanophagales archaeon]|nr:radical SAM protein [Methanophagales archaeon]MCW3141813.1 radical SAM protein [Methanophagales archaeon]
MKFKVARRKIEKCKECGFCALICPSHDNCIGCGACVDACPYEARVLEEISERRKEIKIKVNHERYEVPGGITVLRALELIGFTTLPFKDEKGMWELSETEILAPCRTGGCWSCAVIINGNLKPSCVTPAEEGMEIITDKDAIEKKEPKRVVSGFQGHAVGGVGTPYWIKPRTLGLGFRFIEVACFSHGCILRCPTCQNWEITYSAVEEEPLSPVEAARLVSYERRRFGVDRMAISGGESTLNRRWLLEYLKELKRLNRDKKARLHVDTNAVVLTEDYIDALYLAGATDIGADVKGLELDTFAEITGIKDREFAKKLLNTEWKAIKYLGENYSDKMFVGIGIPYNEALVSLDEIYKIGERIAGWSPDVQVCALDYRPAFRRMDLKKPSYLDMLKVKEVLEGSGLRCVICQTEFGRIGP